MRAFKMVFTMKFYPIPFKEILERNSKKPNFIWSLIFLIFYVRATLDV